MNERRDPTDAFTVVELLVTVCIIALLIAILLPAQAHARKASKTAASANNERSLGLAIFQYAERHAGATPTAYENLWNRLTPYLGEAVVPPKRPTETKVFRCLSDRFITEQEPWGKKNQCSYAPNADETGAGTLKPEEEAGLVVEEEGGQRGIQHSPFTAACKDMTEQVPVRIASVANDTVLLAECWRAKTQNSLFLDKPKMRMRETAGVPEVGSRNSLLLKQYTSTKGVTVASRDKVTDAGPFNFLLDYSGAGGSKSTALSRTYHRGKMNVLYADAHVAAQPVDAIAAAPGQGQYSGMKTLADIPYWNRNED